RTRFSGGGRKSATIRSRPSGSFVYLIFALIDCLTPPPIAGTEDSDDAATVREADGQDAAFNSTEAVVSLFAPAVREILRDHTVWVGKGELGDSKGDAVPHSQWVVATRHSVA